MNRQQDKTWKVDVSHLDTDNQSRWRPYLTDPRRGSRFHNPWTDEPKIKTSRFLQWQLSENPHKPFKKQSHPPEPLDFDFSQKPAGQTRVAWLGHASVLIDIAGLRIVIDPVKGDVANGLVRRASRPVAKQWSHIDVVVLTHGHFDHFDVPTLKALGEAPNPPVFITPLGLSSYLPGACKQRIELNWWEGTTLGEVDIILVPAQHWHRRRLWDMNRALWGGVVLRGEQSVYHSGDTGFFEGFAAISDALGPMDVACLPTGAYEPRWFMGPQHMAPEESAKAAALLKAQQVLAMHWGTFDLSDETISAGPRLMRQAMHQNTESTLQVLKPGGFITLEETEWKAHGAWLF